MTVKGQIVRLSREEVIRSLEDVFPERIYKHAVEIEGRQFPVKQAFAAAAGLDLLDFDTNQARNAFRQLGFEVLRVA